ncbi:hypothetical protein FDUTEX481_07375 [Tolypothrix sp. PCC 7601]|nr:hypothetical protein FDUTEX481_07375 [Tolypothrix sp. PCC 7601]
MFATHQYIDCRGQGNALYKYPRPHPLTPSPSGRRGIKSLAPLSRRERGWG